MRNFPHFAVVKINGEIFDCGEICSLAGKIHCEKCLEGNAETSAFCLQSEKISHGLGVVVKNQW